MKKGIRHLLLIMTAALTLTLTMGIMSVFAAETEIEVYESLVLENCSSEDGVQIKTTYTVTPTTDVKTTYTPINKSGERGAAQTIRSGIDGGLYVKANEGGEIIFTADEVKAKAGTTIDERTKNVLGIDRTKFTEAGIYRYTVSEKNSGQAGVTYDTQTYYVDLFIVATSNPNDYECQAVIVHKDNADYVSKENDQNTFVISDKSMLKFTDHYNTYDVVAEKHITGNQRNDNDKFGFTVSFSGIKANRNINITLLNTDGSTVLNTIVVPVTTDGPATSGSISVGKNQKIKIHGLYTAEKYEITEAADTERRGYITKINSGSFGSLNAGASTGSQTVGTTDEVEYDFVNDKSGAVPTGLFINNWPYIAAALAAVIAAAVIFRKRRTELLDEDL